MSDTKNIILGVTASIAAYKAADIAHSFVKSGFNVETIMTKNATCFITPLTFQTLTHNNVYVDMFSPFSSDVKHISLAKKADICVIAPATADIIAKLAAGFADDMLCATVLALKNVPIVVAPAMNTAMWENPATKNNIDILEKRGVFIIEPQCSLLACGTVGKGAMAQVSEIVDFCSNVLFINGLAPQS